ncbi:MAG: hypothetical protein IH804_05630 [Planctomycetes bacterium]|nr:hypothetical protein [Planctomycetota bacterium]
MSGSAVGERCSWGRGRSRRVMALLGAVVLLSLGDLLVTLAYLKSVGLMEANPIVAYLIESTQSVWVLAGYSMQNTLRAIPVLICLKSSTYRESCPAPQTTDLRYSSRVSSVPIASLNPRTGFSTRSATRVNSHLPSS